MAEQEILGIPKPADAAPKAAAAGDVIKDVTTQTFMQDVIEASRDALVLVDFWAPWCGPCKQLTPTIERVVKEAGGSVHLAKMDIDKNPEVPGQMGVQSIPAVFAFKDGRPLDGFQGALPESEIRKLIEKHVPDAFAEAGSGLDAANAALEAGDMQGAADFFSAMLAEDAANVEALTGLARVCIKSGDLAQAEQILSSVPTEKALDGSVTAAQAMLKLARQSEAAGDMAPLQAKVDADPDDHQARFDLAIALGAADDREAAVDHLLELFSRKRDWNDNAAHTQLMQYFEAWGPTDPAVMAGRRRLSTLLFS